MVTAIGRHPPRRMNLTCAGCVEFHARTGPVADGALGNPSENPCWNLSREVGAWSVTSVRRRLCERGPAAGNRRCPGVGGWCPAPRPLCNRDHAAANAAYASDRGAPRDREDRGFVFYDEAWLPFWQVSPHARLRLSA